MKLYKEPTFNNKHILVLHPDNRVYDLDGLKELRTKIYSTDLSAKPKNQQLKKVLSKHKCRKAIYPVYSLEDNKLLVAMFILKTGIPCKNALAYSIYFDRSNAQKFADDPNSTLINVVSRSISKITPRSQVIVPSFKRVRLYRNHHPLIVVREPIQKKIKRIREETYAKTRKVERNRLEFIHNRISAIKDHLLIVKMISNSKKTDLDKEASDLKMESAIKMSAAARRHNFILSHKTYHFSKDDVLSASAP